MANLSIFPIKRALLSVSDKQNLQMLASFLHQHQVQLFASGGTGQSLKDWGIPFSPVESLTGNPEAFGGRMKTLSFQLSSALLYRRDQAQDQSTAKDLGIEAIDLVVCNFYPFEQAIAELKQQNRDCQSDALPELIEKIDIGGPTMVRAAAKNYRWVAVCTQPQQYQALLEQMSTNGGGTTERFRLELATEAFKLSAHYESVVSQGLANNLQAQDSTRTPSAPILNRFKVKALRYGENPHQKAWVYSQAPFEQGLADIEPIQGKELSYNNYLDADAAWRCCADVKSLLKEIKSAQHACVIVKHLNPCGVATADSAEAALASAWAGDPISAFGGILAFSGQVDEAVAQWLDDKFVEVIVAESFSGPALKHFSSKKNLRLLSLCEILKQQQVSSNSKTQIRSIWGGMLVQEEDHGIDQEFQSVTEQSFLPAWKKLAQFGVLTAKHLKSNAIALVQMGEHDRLQLIGAGMGNPNRLISLNQAIQKARDNGATDLSEAILISDAFFPFPDNIELAQMAGITKIVQPGGSIKDDAVIAACNRYGIAMAFTGKRHFVH